LEALEIIEHRDIHILITDIKMPVMDGLELIQQIRDRGWNIKIIVLSSHDDFKFIKEASMRGIENYLLKPIEEDELSQTILNTIEKLENEVNLTIRNHDNLNIVKENILYRWVTRNIGYDELETRAEFLQIDLSRESYMVCLFSILQNSKFKTAGDIQLGPLSFAILNICSEILDDYENFIPFNSLNGDLIIIFSWDQGQMDSQKLNRLLELSIQKMNEYLKIDVIVSLGPVENGYRSVHRSYQHACRIKDYRLLPPNTLLNFESLQENNAKFSHSFNLDFGHLKSLIISKNKSLATQYIDDLFNRLENGEGVTLEYVRGLSMEILFHVFDTLNLPNIHLDEFQKHSDHALFDILRMHRIADISIWLKSLIADYMGSLEHAYDNIHPSIKAVLQFINKNYAQEMSLKTLSATFNINAAYLGQLFKKATGEMFSNYLNNVRIQKSKELLAHTQLKSNQIATAVGFVNVNYFSNVFKKLEGVYPIEYRKSIQG